EPQEHPDDFAYPGAAPTAPYDIAGWTLAFQMGVKFDRILDAFEAPVERIREELKPPPGAITGVTNPNGYLLSHEINDSAIAVNRILYEKEEVYWIRNSLLANGKTYAPGTYFIAANTGNASKLRRMAEQIGLSFEAVTNHPEGESFALRLPRIALWDKSGG